MKITHTNVIKVEFTLDEVRNILQAYNTDMMIELAGVFFDLTLERRHCKFNLREMAEFAEAMADENRRAELVEKAGVEFIEIDSKAFREATAPVRAKYGAAHADLIRRIEAVR